MKISFITTCMNRESNLKTTLPFNLDKIKNYPEMEIIVLNYSSKGDLDTYIRSINNPQLRYYKEDGEQYFNMSRAKNIGSRLSNSEYILNVDADNFLSEDYLLNLINTIKQDVDVLSMSTKTQNAGLGGRLGCKKEVFNYLRGYDESLQGWGAEDVDFERRCMEYGFSIGYVRIPEDVAATISQTAEEKAANYSKEYSDINITQKRNRELITNSFRSINTSGFGCCTLTDIDNNIIEIKNITSKQLQLNTSIQQEFFNGTINKDMLFEFEKVFGENPNLLGVLKSANLFHMNPIYTTAKFFTTPSQSNICNPIEWCKGNIAAFYVLASNALVIHTDIISFALVALLYGRNVILYGNENKPMFDKYLKTYGCKFKLTQP